MCACVRIGVSPARVHFRAEKFVAAMAFRCQIIGAATTTTTTTKTMASSASHTGIGIDGLEMVHTEGFWKRSKKKHEEVFSMSKAETDAWKILNDAIGRMRSTRSWYIKYDRDTLSGLPWRNDARMKLICQEHDQNFETHGPKHSRAYTVSWGVAGERNPDCITVYMENSNVVISSLYEMCTKSVRHVCTQKGFGSKGSSRRNFEWTPYCIMPQRNMVQDIFHWLAKTTEGTSECHFEHLHGASTARFIGSKMMDDTKCNVNFRFVQHKILYNTWVKMIVSAATDAEEKRFADMVWENCKPMRQLQVVKMEDDFNKTFFEDWHNLQHMIDALYIHKGIEVLGTLPEEGICIALQSSEKYFVKAPTQQTKSFDHRFGFLFMPADPATLTYPVDMFVEQFREKTLDFLESSDVFTAKNAVMKYGEERCKEVFHFNDSFYPDLQVGMLPMQAVKWHFEKADIRLNRNKDKTWIVYYKNTMAVLAFNSMKCGEHQIPCTDVMVTVHVGSGDIERMKTLFDKIDNDFTESTKWWLKTKAQHLGKKSCILFVRGTKYKNNYLPFIMERLQHKHKMNILWEHQLDVPEVYDHANSYGKDWMRTTFSRKHEKNSYVFQIVSNGEILHLVAEPITALFMSIVGAFCYDFCHPRGAYLEFERGHNRRFSVPEYTSTTLVLALKLIGAEKIDPGKWTRNCSFVVNGDVVGEPRVGYMKIWWYSKTGWFDQHGRTRYPESRFYVKSVHLTNAEKTNHEKTNLEKTNPIRRFFGMSEEMHAAVACAQDDFT